jgi:hypothetical protein
MKRRSRLASKVTSSIQDHHEDHLPDISSLSSSRTEPSYCSPVNLDLDPTVVVGTAATSIQEQHEDHLSNEPSSCPPVNHDLSPAVVAGTTATNTDSSTIDSNNDSPSHPNSQSAMLGPASPTIATIQDTVITSPDNKYILSYSSTTFYALFEQSEYEILIIDPNAFFFNNCLNNLSMKFLLFIIAEYGSQR